jgi:hypothetical protein
MKERIGMAILGFIIILVISVAVVALASRATAPPPKATPAAMEQIGH